jgi:hypothetical protein
LAYLERRALLAWALLEQQAPLVPMERQARSARPGLQELQVLTVQQEPPASLEFLVLLVRLVSRAVMVLQAQQVSSG